MKKIFKHFTALLIISAILLSLTSCGSSIPNAFDDGTNNFASGKQELSYDLPNSGELLNYLIDEFSGSMEPPFSEKMDDSDYDEAQKRAEDDTDPPSNTPSGSGQTQNGVVSVENYEQLKKVFLEAYVPSAERVRFKVVNGYSVNLNGDLLNDIYRELQRQDPVGVSAVSSWSYGKRGSEYIIEISYNIDKLKLNRIKSETPALVKKAIKEMNVKTTDHYEIICAVNEYLCDTVVYPSSQPYKPETHTSYGAFNGSAVCEGYAIAAKLMLNDFGINCDIQSGFCNDGGGHAWNLVQLENQWYQMDVTWNDGGSRRTDYLLVTDAYMKKSRSWDESDYPKSATKPYRP